MISTRTDGQSMVGLIRQVADDGAHLARQEVNLARIEFAEIARDIGKGTGFSVAAAMLGMLTAQMFVLGIVLVLGDELFRGRYWIAAFLITAVLAALAVAIALRAKKLLSPRNMIPDQTLATLRSRGHD